VKNFTLEFQGGPEVHLGFQSGSGSSSDVQIDPEVHLGMSKRIQKLTRNFRLGREI
jgi:hypothetical protein